MSNNNNNYYFLFFKIFVFYLIKIETANVNVAITIENLDSFDGPEYMGIGMGHSSLSGNWLKFVERLGINGARLFVSSYSDLRNFIGNVEWGQDLNGNLVRNRNEFLTAITDLRNGNGRNVNFNWKNPIKWNSIFSKINQVSQKIYGSDENTIEKLKSININTLVVEHIGCGSASTTFKFESMNENESNYWSERWELYKFSYAMAVWAWNKKVNMIEFYNEPDLSLGSCLDADTFRDYYFIRSLSIQNAYSDLNDESPLNKVTIKIVASGFARITYGGNTDRYLGDVCVNNRKFKFDINKEHVNWTNMHIYSYHTYGKTGYDMLTNYETIKSEIFADTNVENEIPVIITEHNAHTSSDWDTLTTTADDNTSASRLASQIMYLVLGKIYAHYVFKFSITPSFSALRDIAKNGLHWGEISINPYHLSDTTLSAEAMRILMMMKQSKLYKVTSNDTSKYRTYIGSKNKDGNYYIFIVNDKNDNVNLSIDVSKWLINEGVQIIVETVGSGYWGEISSIIKAPKNGFKININLIPFSVTRLTVPTHLQNETVSHAELTCTSRAGTLSNQSDCSNLGSFLVGTSNTTEHENTSVGIVRIALNKNVSVNQKTVLNVNTEVIGNKNSTLLILGLLNTSHTLNVSSMTWNSLSSSTGLNILTSLKSGNLIDSISKNFINWSSPSNLMIIGHISATNGLKNQLRMIDISDYVSNVIKENGDYLTLLIYRPFRHPFYKTASGGIKADDLSDGSIVKLSNINLKYYWHI